ncbi:tetratricopeptide repeat protein [Actinomadura keratinilytica]|uniref:tetratricopeptide repeat protein n=1 Tax=Actinomadura keratinilytica TaxID=547461 RepID=UPI00360E030A
MRDRAWKRDRDHDHDREREHGRDRSQDRGRVADRRRGAPGPRGQKKAAGRPYGPSRDKLARRKAAQGREEHTPKYDEPAVPEHVTGSELDAEVRAELRALPKDLAGRVSRHLVMAGRLSEEDPQTSYAHAKAARRLASRVGIVREAAGLSAYRAGEWSDALAELRAARRLGTGGDAYLPVMADCERGMGRPERALDLIKSAEGARLDQAGRIELRIVESGARRDLQQYEAAVVALQVPELKDRRLRPWSARLFYAYADALEAAGRRDEASDWFARAAAADRDGETDAAERYAELEGLHIIDTEEDESGAEPADSDEAPPSPTGEEPAEAAETPGPTTPATHRRRPAKPKRPAGPAAPSRTLRRSPWCSRSPWPPRRRPRHRRTHPPPTTRRATAIVRHRPTRATRRLRSPWCSGSRSPGRKAARTPQRARRAL